MKDIRREGAREEFGLEMLHRCIKKKIGTKFRRFNIAAFTQLEEGTEGTFQDSQEEVRLH